jgi:hypothetical protein
MDLASPGGEGQGTAKQLSGCLAKTCSLVPDAGLNSPRGIEFTDERQRKRAPEDCTAIGRCGTSSGLGTTRLSGLQYCTSGRGRRGSSPGDAIDGCSSSVALIEAYTVEDELHVPISRTSHASTMPIQRWWDAVGAKLLTIDAACPCPWD